MTLELTETGDLTISNRYEHRRRHRDLNAAALSGSVLRIWNEDVLAPIDELRGLEYERLPGVEPVRKGGQHLSTSLVEALVGIAFEPPDGDVWRIHRFDELLK